MQTSNLKANDALIKSLMEHSGQMVYIKDLEGRYLQVNEPFLAMLERREDEVIGKTNYDFFPKEYADSFKKNDLQVISSGKSQEFEQIAPLYDPPHIYKAVKFPLFDDNNKVFAICGITRDITERKLAETDLQIAIAKLKESNFMLEMCRSDLERSNRDLESFATVAAHDLKSPLRAITQHLELILANKNNTLEARSQKSMGFVIEGANRMREMIEALLEYSYLGFSQKFLATLDCNKILTIARANLSASIQEKGAIITFDPLPTLTADKIQITQLFQNLIGNAIKFCTETPRIHISAESEGDYWKFSFRDNGIGIADYNLEKIFLIFKRLCSPDEYQGAGIGLSICERVVRNHKGRIWAESEMRQGSTFYFTIPKKLSETSNIN